MDINPTALPVCFAIGRIRIHAFFNHPLQMFMVHA
jgi:hypothetical protein